MSRRWTTTCLGLCLSIVILLRASLPAHSQVTHLATGTHYAVASADKLATQAGIDILRSGGNAVDAAVATAAALGVVEPFSAGIGGGGFMLIYQPEQNSFVTLDGREEASMSVTPTLFTDPDSATGEPLPFFPNRMSSGLAVGVPGTPLNWATATERYGTKSLSELLQPAIALASQGFLVDQTFVNQIAQNQARFAAFSTTKDLYLPNGQLPEVGSQFINSDLAKTYQILADKGTNTFYRGEIGEAISQTVQNPPIVENPSFKVLPGTLTTTDLDRYEVRVRPATENSYRGYRLYGMGLPSSGGITIAQTLNLLELYDLSDLTRSQAFQHIIEAERLAFADRNAYIGDPEFVDVPVAGLLNKDYASVRTKEILERSPENEADYQATAGNPLPFQSDPSPSLTQVEVTPESRDAEGLSTTHLTVVDADGMVVAYTLTIESTGGSGIVVSNYGFILNNELTDFDTQIPHPNVAEAGKRPRSSMAPTIAITPNGSILAFGSPGGSTIITTVLNIATNIIDFGMDLEAAILSPRFSQRNSGATQVEDSFEDSAAGQALIEASYQLNATKEIGAATGISISPAGEITAVAESVRRGGGSAMAQ
ncbi:MAG: gamma-glutamyltransferase [Cyanobacteria bacterium J06621_11]